ncbi:MAG: UDP-N-acetylglucosamine--N-acetylmuramyl-(pentapeptide) pyrophosphoryl-undecaprenol N-acetylglucosamine transferase [Anaerolineae bacterium]|nr:UDP-N-acetylglucosamine--N-acetylmuramyl-(pentapeptide) pyrophosphoryl-undecaprenol N-acetylglucosamine transferase [Anaerolineae bacterium]
MNILFSGGGTGGGVYPAIAIASALTARHPESNILWMGSTTGPESDLVARAGLDYVSVPSGPLVGVGLKAISGAVKIAAGTLKAWGIIGKFKPSVLLITGGWATLPAALACWLRGIPVVIYMPDVEPGGTIKAIARIAKRVAVTAESSVGMFPPGRAVETGYPLRADLLHAAGFDPLGDPLPYPPDIRDKALVRFNLSPDLKTVLVFGGSRGARSLNRALIASLPDLLPQAQVIHITGRLDWPEVQTRAADLASRLPSDLISRYHIEEYLHTDEMALALAASDLVVSRAGASTLGEFPLFDLPAILVPYPHAWRYQKTNADYLDSRGAAVRLDDDKLHDQLTTRITALLEPSQLIAMSTASGALKRPGAAARIASLLLDVAADASAQAEG